MPLIQLLPDQIMTYWEEIKPYIRASLPPQARGEDALLHVQENLLIGEMQCWINMDNSRATGIATTKIVVDEGSLTRNLLIYTFYVSHDIAESAYVSGLEILRKFALAKGCRQIIAYSPFEKIWELAARLGGKTVWRIITFEV